MNKCNKCNNCGKETNNPKYCSRSCAGTINSSIYPKRIKKKYYCVTCNMEVPSRRKYCDSCRFPDMKLSEAMYTKHHKSSAYVLVRTRARSVVKHRLQVCFNCGYDKHVEVCHKKPISEFLEDTLVSKINSPDNLILLFPNCHWEFDHGKLSFPAVI